VYIKSKKGRVLGVGYFLTCWSLSLIITSCEFDGGSSLSLFCSVGCVYVDVLSKISETNRQGGPTFMFLSVADIPKLSFDVG
jgi:hypothetical protein